MVWVNGLEVPYWAAGGLHQPHANGYTAHTVRDAVTDHKAAFSLYGDAFDRSGGFPT